MIVTDIRSDYEPPRVRIINTDYEGVICSSGFSLIFEDLEMTEGEEYFFGDDQGEYEW